MIDLLGPTIYHFPVIKKMKDLHNSYFKINDLYNSYFKIYSQTINLHWLFFVKIKSAKTFLRLFDIMLRMQTG